MTSQSLARRQTTDFALQPPPNGGGVVQHTHAQVRAIQSVILTAVAEMDETYRQVEAYVGRGGRSAGHQRYLQDRAANLLVIHDSGVDSVVRTAVCTIMAERPKEIVRTVSVPEPRKPWYHALTGG